MCRLSGGANVSRGFSGRNFKDNFVTMWVKEDKAPQIRCGNCNKLLGKGTASDLSIKCPRCGCMNHILSGMTASDEGSKPHNEVLHDGKKEDPGP